MKQALTLILLFLFSSCGDKTIDNSMTPCTGGNCAVVNGKFSTGRHDGIPNVMVEVRSETPRAIGNTLTRKLGSGITDGSGYYSFNINMHTPTDNERTKYIMSYKYDQSKYLPSDRPFSFMEEYLPAINGLNQ